MLSCKEVCYMVSESQDRQLPWRERIRIRVHLLMCIACQRMAWQMNFLHAATRHYGSTREKTLHPEQERLSKEASARILTRLRQAENDPADHK